MVPSVRHEAEGRLFPGWQGLMAHVRWVVKMGVLPGWRFATPFCAGAAAGGADGVAFWGGAPPFDPAAGTPLPSEVAGSAGAAAVCGAAPAFWGAALAFSPAAPAFWGADANSAWDKAADRGRKSDSSTPYSQCSGAKRQCSTPCNQCSGAKSQRSTPCSQCSGTNSQCSAGDSRRLTSPCPDRYGLG